MDTATGYGWTSDSGPHSCDYLLPVVSSALSRLGAVTVLDLGAGNGALSRALAERGFQVVGVEPDAAGAAIARRAAPHIPFYELAVGDSPDPLLRDYPKGFDAVVSTEVVEHLYAPRELPRFARSVLTPGGRLILTTPYHGYVKNLALSVTARWDRHLDPLWDGGHIKFWSPTSITRLLTSEGFEMESVRGVGRVPFLWKSMLVEAKRPHDG